MLVGFDEPFHSRLWQGARENSKGTWAELTALWRKCPSEFVPDVRPIEPLDELNRMVTDAQASYFAKLLSQNDGYIVADLVRTWNKMAILVSVSPQPYVVQLVRSPVPWALSHLLPSGKGSWRKPFGDALRRRTALNRKGNYNNWQYEDIVRNALTTRDPIWRHVAITPDRLSFSPAFEKLIAFWWCANKTMADDLAGAAPGRHLILLAEDFLAHPNHCLKKILSCAGLPAADLDSSAVRPAQSDPLQENPAFAAAFDALGIPSTLLPAARPTSETLAAAFSTEISGP